MFHSIRLTSLIVLISIAKISGRTCGDGYHTYYCPAGQSCGSHINDCRGIPTYALVGIISMSIMILSICIRFCLQANCDSSSTSPQQIRSVTHYSGGNNYATRSPVTIEGAPPSYAVATSTGRTKC